MIVWSSLRLLVSKLSDSLDTNTRKELHTIMNLRSTRRETTFHPRQLKLTIGSEALPFNYHMPVGIMFLRRKPGVHMADEASHFTAAQFVDTQSTPTNWKYILQMWSLTYMGPLYHITVDQGTKYVPKNIGEKT